MPPKSRGPTGLPRKQIERPRFRLSRFLRLSLVDRLMSLLGHISLWQGRTAIIQFDEFTAALRFDVAKVTCGIGRPRESTAIEQFSVVISSLPPKL